MANPSNPMRNKEETWHPGTSSGTDKARESGSSQRATLHSQPQTLIRVANSLRTMARHCGLVGARAAFPVLPPAQSARTPPRTRIS